MLWLVISGGLLSLLIAANGNNKKGNCRDFTLKIGGAEENLFISKAEIIEEAARVTGGKIKDMPVSSFNLRKTEGALKKNPWIREAELWFDSRDVLHISVTQREPVARVFTTAGNSFYLDADARQLPLSDKKSARVPVFTGFPEKKKLSPKDSLMMKEITGTAKYILNNPFWMAQAAQLDIITDQPTGYWQFEMIPVVGNHIIRLGNGEHIDKKFNRLFIFYKQVLGKTGFDAYSILDVQFDGQVVGTKKDGKKQKIDAVQLKRNVENMISEAKQMKQEVIKAPVIEKPEIKKDSVIKKETEKPISVSEVDNNKEEPRVPKAVMPKRTEQENDHQ